MVLDRSNSVTGGSCETAQQSDRCCAADHGQPEVAENRAGECYDRDPSEYLDVEEWVHSGCVVIGCGGYDVGYFTSLPKTPRTPKPTTA